eukprot:scaffold61109_cov22-Cyclotella_meneghiniana.AAC.4
MFDLMLSIKAAGKIVGLALSRTGFRFASMNRFQFICNRRLDVVGKVTLCVKIFNSRGLSSNTPSSPAINISIQVFATFVDTEASQWDYSYPYCRIKRSCDFTYP